MSLIPLDAAWRKAHPLPDHGDSTDKNARGRVLLIGGSAFVPGALRLTAEAALRAGAGKLQMATVETASMPLGVLVPEAAMIGLPADADGEIAPEAAEIVSGHLDRCDALVMGPGMSSHDNARALLEQILPRPTHGPTIVLDAAAVSCVSEMAEAIAAHEGRVVMTPHHGEMASLTGLTTEEIADDPALAATDTARRFRAVIVLKAAETLIATPDGDLIHYAGGCVGLATGGSGDVLAGIIGGLAARGADPVAAAAWGVWLHGEAGQAASARLGPIGFLARDLVEEIPGLMARASEALP